MPKSMKRKSIGRKHVKNKTLNIKGCADNPTYYHIRRWYESSFEKLGWMVLSQKNGYTDEVTSYKLSVMRLRDCISKKHSKMNGLDKKDDLKIMLDNTEVLIKHINKDF
jgi:hypothetical protein